MHRVFYWLKVSLKFFKFKNTSDSHSELMLQLLIMYLSPLRVGVPTMLGAFDVSGLVLAALCI